MQTVLTRSFVCCDPAAVRLTCLQALVASRNPNVINIIAVCFDPMTIIMEACDTSLGDYVRSRGAGAALQLADYPPYSWPVVVNLATQAAAALTALHERPLGILHNDVRAANMVLVTAGRRQQLTSSQVGAQQQVTLKICDFGLAEFVGEGEEACVPKATNPLWLPPDIRTTAEGMWRVNKKTDVFGLGEP